MHRPRVLATALAMFIAWMVSTWWLEGRIHTFMRPQAAFDRAVYAVVANLLLGVAGSLWMLRRWRDAERLDPAASGFGRAGRSVAWLAMGALIGFGSYVLQGAPSRHPVVVLNAFAQVFVVSAAEVLVCWSLVGRAVEASLQPEYRRLGTVAAAVAASVLFGLYHFAHSPPFNTAPMVALLTVVGLATGLFFFVSRDVAGTIVFHNFLGVFGVVKALDAAGQLAVFERPQAPLLAMAGLTAAMIGAGYALLRNQAQRPA